MRTTLTLDDDVAAALERRRASRGTRLRDEVNDLLRAGLAATASPSGNAAPYQTSSSSCCGVSPRLGS